MDPLDPKLRAAGRWVVPYVTIVVLAPAMGAAFMGWLHATTPPVRGQGV